MATTAPPTSTGSVKLDAIKQKVEANTPEKLSGLALYSRFAFAGAVCCSVTHGGLTPVDVVKTRIQLDPVTYNRGLVGGFRQVIANEGAGALMTGAGPTFAGYFLQGAFKFGGYELFKQQAINYLGYETAANNRTAVYLASSACAEFFADIALCPLEATRIRLVSDPKYASGLVSGFTKMARTEGIGAFYSGFGPICFKQIPYTMAKFVVYEKVAEAIWQRLDKSTASGGLQTTVNLGSGLIAGFAAALVSQPADTMLSKARRYASYSEDEDEDEEDEEEDDYDSASSDMEAGRADIDEEEMLSARVARKEDEEALREENELKRQKLERQRKLERLQATAASKKKIY